MGIDIDLNRAYQPSVRCLVDRFRSDDFPRADAAPLAATEVIQTRRVLLVDDPFNTDFSNEAAAPLAMPELLKTKCVLCKKYAVSQGRNEPQDVDCKLVQVRRVWGCGSRPQNYTRLWVGADADEHSLSCACWSLQAANLAQSAECKQVPQKYKRFLHVWESSCMGSAFCMFAPYALKSTSTHLLQRTRRIVGQGSLIPFSVTYALKFGARRSHSSSCDVHVEQ